MNLGALLRHNPGRTSGTTSCRPLSLTVDRRRIAHIDGLRAIAVLSVALFHASAFANQNSHGVAAAVLASGRRGVDLFFMLSGFCLAYPTLHAIESRGLATFDVVGYIARRAVRIVPPYWLAILLLSCAFAAAHTWWGYVAPGSERQYDLSIPDLLRQAFFFDKGTQLLNASFWTLPLELRWYVLFPVMLLIWVKSSRAFIPIIAAALLILATPSANRDAAYLPEFLLGIVAASIYVNRLQFGPWLFGLLVLTVGLALTPLGAGLTSGFSPAWCAAMFLLVVCAGNSKAIARALSAKWLCAIGVASYSIYLVHLPAIQLSVAARLSPTVAVIVAIASGFVFWFVAERPFTETALRVKLISVIEGALSSLWPHIGVNRSIAFSGAKLAHESLANDAAPARIFENSRHN